MVENIMVNETVAAAEAHNGQTARTVKNEPKANKKKKERYLRSKIDDTK